MTDNQQSPEEESDLLTIAYMDGYYNGRDAAFSRLRKVINRWRTEASRLDREAADLSRNCRDADATRRLAEAKLRRAMASELERTLESEK